MRPLPPVTSMGADTAIWHGGNEYRGPGAWKKPRVSKKRFRNAEVVDNGPLDLTVILGQGWRRDVNKKHQKTSYKTRNRSKQRKYGALQARLSSLSLLLPASHDVGSPFQSAGELSSTHENKQAPATSSFRQACSSGLHIDASPDLQRQPYQISIKHGARTQPKTFDEDDPLEKKPEREPICEIQSNVRQKKTARLAKKMSEPPGKQDTGQHRSTNAAPVFLVPNQNVQSPPLQGWNSNSLLRMPNPATKMSVDNRCNAELLDARATLRVLLKQQKQLGEKLRQRRLEACLGTGGGTARRKNKPLRQSFRQGRRHNNQTRNLSSGEVGVQSISAHAHPLLFMTEAGLQELELKQMQIEDAEATVLSTLEEARRRKDDYSTYYDFALRYGPLNEEEFELATYPGKICQAKTTDAIRMIQNWWWSVWPSLLRRRKAAALVIQAVFRGFVQKKRWCAIIRLRTLWGNTRIIAHAFTCWRDIHKKIKRVRVFTHHFHNRCKLICLMALVNHAKEKRKLREDAVRDSLRRVSAGIRFRVFEAWVRFTDISLAVERMHRRSSTRPVFRVWWMKASASRRYRLIVSACGVLVSRLLRFKCRARYAGLRRSCIGMQHIVRVNIARTRVKKRVEMSRARSAEEAVQALEDERIRCLIEAEQQRRNRLQAVIDQDAPLTQKNASAFLQTVAGKEAVANKLTSRRKKEAKVLTRIPGKIRLRVAGGDTVSEAEAKEDITRWFVAREQSKIRHDFDATSPPPLRCPRPDCYATFVDLGHCVHHAADVHTTDEAGVAELAQAFCHAESLATFEEYVEKLLCGAVAEEADSSSLKDKYQTVRNTLGLWKAIQKWRAIVSTSDLYNQLGMSILNQLGSIGGSYNKNDPEIFSNIQKALNGEILRFKGETGIARHECGHTLRGRGGGVDHDTIGNTNQHAVDPLVLEGASWQAVVSLHHAVGRAFLESSPYAKYLDGVNRPIRDAVAAMVAGITARERAKWSAEVQMLKTAATHRAQETSIDAMSEEALTLVLEGASSEGVLWGIVDDQATLLATVIIAERVVFAKVISTSWKEAVDEATHLATCELREVDLTVVNALSDATVFLVRSRVMDELIDQVVLDLTGPQGEFWSDARAMAAVADGVAYRVRCDVMENLLEELVSELQDSGEAEDLMFADKAWKGQNVDTGDGESRTVAKSEELWAAKDGFGAMSSALVVVESQKEPNTGLSGITTASTTAMSTAGITPTLGGDETYSHGEGLAAKETYGDGRHSRGWNAGNNDSDGIGHSPNKETTTAMEICDSDLITEKAVVMVQSALRRKEAYRRTKTLVARNFIKLYDPASEAFYWYNQATSESTWEKPAIIDVYFNKPPAAAKMLGGFEQAANGETFFSSFQEQQDSNSGWSR